jgi:hypothetical protein
MSVAAAPNSAVRTAEENMVRLRYDFVLRWRNQCRHASRFHHCASTTQRKPRAAERSMLGAIIKSFPCSVSLNAWGKYQIEPCG